MAEMKGAKNNVPTKQSAVVTAVSPVRPPASTPVADSMKAPEVVVPIKAAKVVARASAIMGRSICGQVAVLVEKAGAGGDSDQGAHRVHESDHEDGQHDREKSPGEDAVQVKFKKDRREAGRTADPCRSAAARHR